MKSTINTIADFHDAEFERQACISCPEDYIEKQLRHITRSHKKTVDSASIENGDVVMLTLKSNTAKFNRIHLPLTVGGGLFDSTVEASLIGHTVGDNFSVAVDSEPVDITVESAKRTVYPEPTDDMVPDAVEGREDMEGVTTVAEYIAKTTEAYEDEARRDAIYGAMDEVLNYVLTNSDWNFDESEKAEMLDSIWNEVNESAKEECGKSIDEMSDDEIKAYSQIDGVEALRNEITNEIERQIASTLFVCNANGVDASTVTPDDSFNLRWDFLEEYIKNSITFTK